MINVIVLLKHLKIHLNTFLQGTYDYGEQVVQAALVLRRSCRFALTPVHEREEMLAKNWKLVADMIIERGKKLEEAVEFYRNSEQVNK